MYKLVLFDFDGTILDSDMMIVATFRELYKKYRPSFNPPIEHMLKFSGPPIRDTLLREFPNENQTLMFDEYLRISTKNYDKYIKLFPGVIECLKLLKENNIDFALVTSKARGATDYAFKLTGLSDVFPLSICADEVNNVKPSPEGVYKAMSHFGIINKSDVIYVGDGQMDYDTAKNAAIDFAFVGWSPRKLKKDDHPTMIIDSFNDLLMRVLK